MSVCQAPLLRLQLQRFLSTLCFPQSESHQFRVMAAVLRHCLLIVGPTEDKTEELHRWVTFTLHLGETRHLCLIALCVIVMVNYEHKKGKLS